MSRGKPINRLKSRKLPRPTAENLINTRFRGSKLWSEEWAKAHVTNNDLVIRPGRNMEGMCYYRGNGGQQLIGSGQHMEGVDLYHSNGTIRIVQHVTVEKWNRP